MANTNGFKSLLDMAMGGPENIDLGMLAKWGQPLDNEIRNAGSQIQSPVVPLDSKLNFEQRILKPNSYPVIDNGDGSESTHQMAWGGEDGNFIAFPTIIQGKDGKLIALDDRQAMQYAQQTGEFRQFSTEQEAGSYADGGYKKFWGLGEKK